MEALIIAAGRGSRLSRLCSPKPLTPIFGLRLIERIIFTGKLAGIRKFHIVIGYQADKIKKEIGTGSKYGVEIHYIYNPDWEKGNGVSVLTARESMSEQFLLLMSDHLFDEEMLRKLVNTPLQNDHCILCVDKNLSGDHFDLEDVTKVSCQSGKVRYIDKGLKKFNAIDTGVFLCTPVIFRALEKSVARGEYSLSAGNQVLATQGRLDTLDITGCFWVDVDNESALRKAKKILIQQLFKPTDGLISKNVNRKLSTKISAGLAQLNVSPNILTLVGFSLSILSAVFFCLGGYGHILLAGIMAQLSSILDGCDGEIARLKFKFSSFGEWLDKILDRYADGLIVLGMTHALWLTNPNEYVWLAGFFALTGSFMNSYTSAIFDRLLRNSLLESSSIRIGRDLRLFLIFLGSLLNQLFLTLIILAGLTNIESIRRVFLLRHHYQTEAA